MPQPPKTLALVVCSRQKRDSACKAEDLYCSERFVLSRDLAKELADEWLIVSAKHGLVSPETVLEPYDKPLQSFSTADRREWEERFALALKHRAIVPKRFILLGDSDYFTALVSQLLEKKREVFAPLSRIEKSNWIAWLKCAKKNSSRRRDLKRLYRLLAELGRGLGGPRHVKDCSGALPWPERGLYLFFHPGEKRLLAEDTLRVARVGTHAVSEGSKSSLWQRLKTHKGHEDGSGNHRGSIFRLHVGGSLLGRAKENLPSWGKGDAASPKTRLAAR